MFETITRVAAKALQSLVKTEGMDLGSGGMPAAPVQSPGRHTQVESARTTQLDMGAPGAASDGAGATLCEAAAGAAGVQTLDGLRLLHEGIRVDEVLGRDIRVKVASRRSEREQAYRLVAENYRKRGYELETGAPLRFTPYHILPDTATFVAKEGETVVATLSLVFDNTLLGLPIEKVFGAEIHRLRQAQRRVAEVTGLADAGLGLREFVPVFVALMRMMAQYYLVQGADALVITINPRHRNFYTKVMGFEPLARECRAHAMVQDAPAEAYILDVERLRSNAPTMYRKIYGEMLHKELLEPAPLSEKQALDFANQSTQTTPEEIKGFLALLARCGQPRRWL